MNKRILPLLLLLPALGSVMVGCTESSTQKKYGATVEKPNQAPSCFLVGEMKSNGNSPKAGFESSLGNAVRLKFGADNLEACKQVAISYCNGSLSRGFSPYKLTIIFTTYAPERTSAYFSLKGNCSLEPAAAP